MGNLLGNSKSRDETPNPKLTGSPGGVLRISRDGQARIHTGFHCFKEIGNILHKKEPLEPLEGARLGNRSVFILGQFG